MRENKGIYNRFARALRWCYKKLRPGWQTVCEETPPQNAVYLVHHQNLAGPVNAVAYLPAQVRVWALEPFLDRMACFEQYYNYTFTKRFGWPKPAAYVVAGLLSFIVPPVVRSFGAVPVYRGGAGSLATMRSSVQDLLQGENILLCPDVEYENKSPEIGDVYTGFLLLERMYHKKAKEHLPFVPTFYSKASKQFVVGKAIWFKDDIPFRVQMEDVATQIKDAINDMGARYGDLAAYKRKQDAEQME